MEESKKFKDNYQWIKMLAIGFSIVSFFVSIAIIGYLITQILNR